MIANPNFNITTGEETGGAKINNHNHDGIDSVKIKPYNVIPSYVMTDSQITYYLSKPAIEGDEFNVYNSTTSEYLKYIRVNKTWFKVGIEVILGSSASDNLQESLDTERSVNGNSSGTPKSVKIFKSGSVRISFEYHVNSGFTGNYGYIRKNGVNLQTVNLTSTSYIQITKDIDVAFGDTIDFYVNLYGTSSAYCYVRNFRIYYDNVVLSEIPDSAVADTNL